MAVCELFAVAYSQPYQTSKMNLFGNIVQKNLILDFWHGLEYASLCPCKQKIMWQCNVYSRGSNNRPPPRLLTF